MTDALRLAALNIGFLAVGTASLLALGLPRRAGWLPTIGGLAPATGIAVCALGATAGAMVGIDVGLWPVAGLAALAVAALAFARRRAGPVTGPDPRPAGLLGRGIELACLALLAVLSVEIVGLAAATGLDQWDGWALWGAKAHALYAGGDVWSPVFTEPEYVMQHQEYPVLLPSLEALSAEALGRFDPTLIDVQAAVVVVAFGWGAWALLRLVVHPAVAAAAALALTGSAPLATNAVANYADAVVASLGALGILCLFLWLTREGPHLLVLAALFLTAASLTKSEGLLFVLAAILSALLLARPLGRSLATACRFAAAVLILPAAWAIVDRLNGPGARNVDAAALLDPAYLADAADRIPTAAEAMRAELFGGWPLACLAAGVALAAACVARAWWAGLFVALWAALSFAALVLVYFLSTSPIDWLVGTSADRVVFSIALGTGVLAPALAALAWQTRAGAEPTIDP